MRRIVFLLSFLFLALVLISGSGNTAFAKGGEHHQNSSSLPPPAVANVVCSSGTVNNIPTLVVSAYGSANVNVAVATDGNETCAQALADLLNAGLKIKNVQTVNPNVVLYTLTGGFEDQ